MPHIIHARRLPVVSFFMCTRKTKQPRENKSKPAYNAMGNKSEVAAILRNANARETVFFVLCVTFCTAPY